MKTTKYPAYETIADACSGDKEAIETILKHYDIYISKVCLKPVINDSGNTYLAVDMELKGMVQSALINMILKFKLEVI